MLLCLTCYPSIFMYLALYLCLALWKLLVSIARG